METKITLKQAMETLKLWYPKNYINITIEYSHYNHSAADKLVYNLYIDTVIRRTSYNNHSLPQLLASVRPLSISIDEQLDEAELAVASVVQSDES